MRLSTFLSRGIHETFKDKHAYKLLDTTMTRVVHLDIPGGPGVESIVKCGDVDPPCDTAIDTLNLIPCFFAIMYDAACPWYDVGNYAAVNFASVPGGYLIRSRDIRVRSTSGILGDTTSKSQGMSNSSMRVGVPWLVCVIPGGWYATRFHRSHHLPPSLPPFRQSNFLRARLYVHFLNSTRLFHQPYAAPESFRQLMRERGRVCLRISS